MQATKSYITSNEPENAYSLDTPVQHRKAFAQFFTPNKVADLMIKWVLGNAELKRVLEPAFGLGLFSRKLLNKNPGLKIEGFEIDSNIFQKAENIFAGEVNVNLRLQDYIYSDWNTRYDGIICNPPYFKFHDYDNKPAIREVEQRMSCKLNGFTNLYTLFLLKSIYQLNKNGRAAYLIPSEFLNSDYGRLIKSYLIKTGCLRQMIIIDSEQNIFDDALTTASILLLANDDKAGAVSFTNVKSQPDLAKIEESIKAYPETPITENLVNFENLDPEIKWRTYYQKQNKVKFNHLVPFTEFGRVVRGIATGANDYFIFSKSKAEQYGISDKFLLPCICKAADVKTSFFTNDDFDNLRAGDKSIYLLNPVSPHDEYIENYLKKGREEGIDKKHLTAHRKIWYLPENRLSAPIWVSVFNRDDIKFIRNEAGIKNLTTFHCIYINKNIYDDYEQTTDLVFAYLLTTVARSIFNDNRREYGNGLKKFEPNDINKSQILNLHIIEDSTREKILRLYKQYRDSALRKIENKEILAEINGIFIDYFAK